MSGRRLERPSGLVVVAERPELSGFLRPDDRMATGSSMLAGMRVLGVIATPDRSTRDTKPQVDPAIAHLDAGRTAALGHRAHSHFLQFSAEF